MKECKEPIAIVGIGCRFPGSIHSPDSLFNFLLEKKDAISDVPIGRWSTDKFFFPGKTPGKINNTKGGFIADFDQFDASFFGISPREASQIDPQHRLLLEVSLEMMEDAGIPLDKISGSDTGVFIGLSSHDYADIQQGSIDIDVYNNIGTAQSVAANRISYFFNLKGPSLIVDTACSSSLTAVHYACHSLYNEECSAAIVGGVNLMFNPMVTKGFSIATMVSPVGQCRAFDRDTSGFARSEGAGVVLLKPLSKALEDGNTIYAVIAETLVNQDGRTQGITLPSNEAQAKLLMEVYRKAGINPNSVNYIECHGTGTGVGDPIEAEAIGQVFSDNRSPNQPLYLGSVKTNIGHLEPASGIAGLIKAALALKYDLIPPNIHFDVPNPKIDFEKYHMVVPTEAKEWNTKEKIAGVNSFGFGGVNAHAILKAFVSAESKSEEVEPLPETSLYFPLSAGSRNGLEQFMQSLLGWVNQENEFSLKNLSYSLTERRTQYQYRYMLIAKDKQELISGLEKALSKEVCKSIDAVQNSANSPKLVWVFSGQGPQWWKMGRELLETNSLFKEIILNCDQLLEKWVSWSLYEELMASSEEASRINQTDIAQPAIFAIQIGLAKLWESYGISPAAIVGHSVGEVAAAYVAGMYSLEQAIEVIYHRSHIQHKARGLGKMLAVGLSEEDVAPYLEPFAKQVSIGAINGLSSVTLSGDTAPLEQLRKQFEEEQIFCNLLRVDYAFHSPQMDPYQDELLEVLHDVRSKKPTVPIWSTVTGERVGDNKNFDNDYWWENVRKPVLFSKAIMNLVESGYETFLEIGPHPVLMGNISECLWAKGKEIKPYYSLRRNKPEHATLFENLAGLFRQGFSIRWPYPNSGEKFMKWPQYPWQHQRYWRESEESRLFRLGERIHPLLEYRRVSPHFSWQTLLSLDVFPYLADHKVEDQVIFPGAGYLEMALGAGSSFLETPSIGIRNLKFLNALSLKEPTILAITINKDCEFEIYDKPEFKAEDWELRASGVLEPDGVWQEKTILIDRLIGTFNKHVQKAELYERFSSIGLNYGAHFQSIQELYYRRDISLAKLVYQDHETKSGYRFHPTFLDGAFQAMIGVQFAQEGDSTLYLPEKIERFSFLETPIEGEYWSYCRVKKNNGSVIVGDISLYSSSGEAVAEVTGLICRAVGLQQGEEEFLSWFYEYQWEVDQTPHTMLSSDVEAPQAWEGYKAQWQTLIQDFNSNNTWTPHYPVIERLCVGYIAGAFKEMELALVPGNVFTTEEFFSKATIKRGYFRLFQRYLEILKARGYLVEEEIGRWEVVKESATGLPHESRDYQEAYKIHKHQLDLVNACGSKIAKILRGEEDPVQVIFGNEEAVSHLYSDSANSGVYNKLVAVMLKAMAKQKGEHRILKILEIGAGTGGTTAHVLPELASDNVHYSFTDLSSGFFEKAKRKFEAYQDIVTYRILDIEKDPMAQGFDANSFDVIVASNALHATRHLKQTLTHVNKLLAPGGQLLLTEITNCSIDIELIFSLTDGWWLFDDLEWRHNMPLLTWDKWSQICLETGFEEIRNLAEGIEGPFQSILLARKPLEQILPEKRFNTLLLGDENIYFSEVVKAMEVHDLKLVSVVRGEAYRQIDERHFEICATSYADWQELMNVLKQQGISFERIVDLTTLSCPDEEKTSSEALGTWWKWNNHALLNLVKTIAAFDLAESTSLYLVSGGIHTIGNTAGKITQAPTWGLGRTLNSEMDKLKCTLLDLELSDSPYFAQTLLNELMRVEDLEDEIAYRNGIRYVNRLVPNAITNDPQEVQLQPEDNFRLNCSQLGVIDNLYLEQVNHHEPTGHEVKVRIEAAGLNFRDVMKVMGIYPDEGDEPFFLGDEFSGVVCAVGDQVQDFVEGDRVFGVGIWTYASFVITTDSDILKMPEHLSFEEAATIPLVFSTVVYSLHELTQLKSGDKILIHSAAGGVGQAAIQYAQHVGAEIFATAGNEEKREMLRQQGVLHVMDSRTLGFADEIMAITQGKGVDVVLNSLAGEAIIRSLEVLGEQGKFIEIGKRDIYENKKIGLGIFRKNISYHAVDLSRILAQQQGVMQKLLTIVVKLLKEKILHPLPYQRYDIENVKDVFSFMAQGKHSGKLVLSLGEKKTRRGLRHPEKKMSIDPQGSYLITGGLGGFGMLLAEWFVERGAGQVVLMSRSGIPSEEAAMKLEALDQSGTCITIAQGDVCVEGDIKRILEQGLFAQMPLKGIVHGAMVLDDGLLVNLDQDRFHRALEPKALGALNLHRLTQHLPLDFFVLFSSISSAMGNPGQGNYVAGNYFLDVLSAYRRKMGLKAVTINWGMLGEVGFLAKNIEVQSLVTSNLGLKAIMPGSALQIFEYSLLKELTQAVIFHVDWEVILSHEALGMHKPRFAQLRKRGGTNRFGGQEFAQLNELLELPTEDRLATIENIIIEKMTRIFGTTSEDQDWDVLTPLNKLGLDSLMAVELRNWMRSTFGVELSLMELMKGESTIQSMAYLILAQIMPNQNDQSMPSQEKKEDVQLLMADT